MRQKQIPPTDEAHTVAKRIRPNLVGRIVTELHRMLAEDSAKPGDRLPSEAALTLRFGVSRTVIREAIAALRADGLVESRQGAGVFVREPPSESAVPFRNVQVEKISSVIEILELRTAIEVEAASFAALRRSPTQEEAIFEAYAALDALIAAGQPTSEGDFALHLAIAAATNNPRFRECLELMGRTIIPRSTLQEEPDDAAARAYLTQIQAEHRRIIDAISARDELGAREAMRQHLTGSQNRYRRMLRSA